MYKLYSKSELNDFAIACIGRRPLTNSGFIRSLNIKTFIPDALDLDGFVDHIKYVKLDLDNGTGLDSALKKLNQKFKTKGNNVFYLATPPRLFDRITTTLGNSSTLREPGFKRVIFEKPFGYNLNSAIELQKCISKVFAEDQIYRIDHYLGKELVQNLLVFRFANAMINEIWNQKFIDNIQITLAETVGVEDRATYYDKAGAIRDMVQNHLMQVLTLVTMQSPKSSSADDIRNAKVKVLKSMRRIKPGDIVLGQYSRSKGTPGYRNEPGIPSNSKTETYAAMKLMIDNNTWKDVPIYVRTGKRLNKKYSDVNIALKDTTCKLFCGGDNPYPNVITVRIQPDEGWALKMNAKVPGPEIRAGPVIMDFCHKCLFGVDTPASYEMLLHQIMIGDQTLFARWDEVLESWKLIDPILGKGKIQLYKAGSMGPKAADELLEKDGRKWV